MTLSLRPATTSRAAAELTRALSVPLLDPLWMFGRQEQTTELLAEDAGSVVGVELTLETASLTALQTPDGATEPVDVARRPLDAVVDAEPAVALDARPLDELAGAGLELLRTLDDHDAGAARAIFAGARYGLRLGDDEWELLEPSTRRRLRPWRGRVPDPRLVVADVVDALGPTGAGAGPLPALPGLPVTDAGRAEAALRDWLAWLDPSPTAPEQNPAWQPERLESTFSVTAPTTTGTVRLRAVEHLGGGLDWHAFVRSTLPARSLQPRPQRRPAPQLRLPAPVRFPGMPLPRFWELEDGDVNLDMQAATDDRVGLRALLGFLHQHGNDWCTLPVELPTGSITLVRSLAVTTTFGERIDVPAAAHIDGAAAPWQLFTVSGDPDAEVPTEPSPLVLVHATGAHPTGPVLEDVLLLRDEMANLAWAVERITSDLGGGRVDRFARHQRLRPPAPARPGYRLGSSVPDYWYPLQATASDDDRPMLELATLPGPASGVPDLGVRGVVLDHDAGARLQDEEVPRDGALVTRRWHRARWSDGSTHTWRARRKQAGTGEGSSGLRFDFLDDATRTGAAQRAAAVAQEPELLRNPSFAHARVPAPSPLVGLGGSLSAAEDWTLWNNADATTVTSLEPTTRLGATGTMLRLRTDRAGGGLVQQWAPDGFGPMAATVSAWVYVIRGRVVLGAGNGGNTGADTASEGRGGWQRLSADAGVAPVNEVILYADDPEGAEVLVDELSLIARDAAPEPAPAYGLPVDGDAPLRILALARDSAPFDVRLRGHAFGAELPATRVRVLAPDDVNGDAPVVAADRRAPLSTGWRSIIESWRVEGRAQPGVWRIELEGGPSTVDAPLTTLAHEAAVLVQRRPDGSRARYAMSRLDGHLIAIDPPDAPVELVLGAGPTQRCHYRVEDARGGVVGSGHLEAGTTTSLTLDPAAAAAPWRLRVHGGFTSPFQLSFESTAPELLLARDPSDLAAITRSRTMYPLAPTQPGIVVHALRPSRAPAQLTVRASSFGGDLEPLSLRLLWPAGEPGAPIVIERLAPDAPGPRYELDQQFPSDAPPGLYTLEVGGGPAGLFAPLTTLPHEAARLTAGRSYQASQLDLYLGPVADASVDVALRALTRSTYRVTDAAGAVVARGELRSGGADEAVSIRLDPAAHRSPWRLTVDGGRAGITAIDVTADVLAAASPSAVETIRQALGW